MIPVADTWDWLEFYQMNFHQFLGKHSSAFFAEDMYLNLQQWNLEVSATYNFKAWPMESSHMQSSILSSHHCLSFHYWLNAEEDESLEDGTTLGWLETASLNDCMKQSPFLTSFDCDVVLLQHLALLNTSLEDDRFTKKSEHLTFSTLYFVWASTWGLESHVYLLLEFRPIWVHLPNWCGRLTSGLFVVDTVESSGREFILRGRDPGW